MFVLFQVRKCIAEGGFAVGELRHYCCAGFQSQDKTYNVTLRRVRATLVAVEKQLVLRILNVCVCSLRYPACKAHAPYYRVICGLPRSTVFFHIIS